MQKKWLVDLSTVWKLQSTLISVISHNHIILDLRKNLCKNVILCIIMLWTLKAVFCTFEIEFLLHYNTDNKNLSFHIVIHSTEAV